MKCGLLGEKLGHSYSPQIHSHLGSYSYELFEKTPNELEDFLANGAFTGINVTIPYKKAVIPHCTELTEIAARLGAVNTIIRGADGSLLGHNSDYFGFRSMVEQSGLDPAGKKCLVLGSGGASVTVQAVLKELGAQVIVISRSGENNYSNLHLHEDAAILINTTPVGMYPRNGESPISLDGFPRLEGVLDLIYNPARTKLLLDAQKRGLVAMNGLWMLVAQAKESAEYFTGNPVSDGKIRKIHSELCRKMHNIVLIGMPGCGKTTVGNALANVLNRPFIDSDHVIVETEGRCIPEIFASEGEDYFRHRETEAIARIGNQSGLVISTGGGCVTREENYPLLHQNGIIFWLQRDLNRLSAEGRPLSAKSSAEELYRIRKPFYERFADYVVDNNQNVDSVVKQILAILEEL